MRGSEEQRQELEDWRTVLATPAGRRVAERLLARGQMLAPSYAPGDALATAYNEGLRGLGLYVAGMVLAVDPKHLTTILIRGDCHESGSNAGYPG